MGEIYKKYPRGSEWRKWDLHVHTPSDHEWINKPNIDFSKPLKDIEDELKKFAKDFIKFAMNEKLAVLAIVDHNFCNNLEKCYLPYIINEAKIKNITILPGFEITVTDGSGIHLLVIFKENTNLNKIYEIVKQCFNPGEELIPATGQVTISNKSIDQLKELLDNSKEDYVFIFAHADRDNGVLDRNTISGGRRIQEWQKKFINIAQLSKKPDEFGTNNFIYKVINKEDVNYSRDITYIVASDCRSINKNLNRKGRTYLGQKYVWIKADPTFEGLKQIIYEPEERVRIQEDNPDNDFPKQVFSEIKINKTKIFENGNVKFKQQNIPLNSNLVTIIGGRGTGKSLLLDCISKVFNKSNKRAESISIQNDDFIIEFEKFDGTKEEYKIQEDNELDYLHIHQGYVKEIVDSYGTDKLDSEIKKLLNIKDIDFSKNESEIIHLIDEIFEIKNFLLKEDEEGNKINSKEYIQRQIEKKRQLIENITTKQNKNLIEQYTKNLKQIDLFKNKINDLNRLANELNEFQANKNNMINEINKIVENEENKIPPIDFNEQIEKINTLITSLDGKIKKLNEDNEKIKKSFIEQGIKGDITTLLEQTESYQNEINKLNEKLKEVERKENDLDERFKEIEKFILDIEEKYNNYKKEVIDKWENLKKGKEDWSDNQKKLIKELLKDIEIEADEIFEIDKFYELIVSYGILNMMKFRPTKDKSQIDRIKEFFNITNKDDYKKFLKNELFTQGQEFLFKDLIDSDYFNKEGAREFLKLLILDFYKYWKVITKPKYKNKELYQLSAGMKGTMFLCIKLATDPFMKPFIFDQPEDDLDNDFIVNELVPIFREIKKYRQVIIATHNANLVVNADAEQVIIAKNNNEELQYFSGSIENPNIREQICKILEGGKEAFEKRKNKYSFKFFLYSLKVKFHQ